MSYIGKNPKADSVKLNSTAVIPTGAAVEGQVYYNDGTGTISEGLKVYKNGNFVGIDKQLGDADTIALKKAVDVGSLQWAVAINSTSTTVGMNNPIPQYDAASTGFENASSTFSNSSTGNALLTDESADLVFAYESHTVDSKNDYFGVQIDIPKAFRGGNLVLSFEYRTAEASGATSDDDFRVSVQDNTTANRGQTTSGTGVTGSQAAGTSILVGSSTNFTVGDRVRVESGTGVQGAQANDFTEAYVTAIADATHLTFSETIVFPSTVGALIAGGWLTDKVPGQLVEADSDTNKVGKERSIQFKTEETTETINVTFQNLSTSAAGIDLFVDNILLSANKFLQASSQGQSECYYAYFQNSFWEHGGGAHCKAWDISMLVPQVGTPPLAQSKLLDIELGATVADQVNITARQDIRINIQVGGNTNASGFVAILNSSGNTIARQIGDRGTAHAEPSASCEIILAKGDYVYLYQQDSSSTYGEYGSATITATSQVSDVVILESQDEIFTDWVSYTPTTSLTGGTIATQTGQWRRVGDSMEVEIYFEWSTIFTGGNFYFTLPSGYSVDTSKVLTPNNAEETYYGEAVFWDNSGTVPYYGRVGFSTTTQVKPIYGHTINGNSYIAASSALSTTLPFTWANDDTIFLKFKVPIQGWNANFNPLLSMPLVEIGANTESYLAYNLEAASSMTYRSKIRSTGVVQTNTISNLGTITNDSTLGWNFQSNQRVKVSISVGVASSTGVSAFGIVKTTSISTTNNAWNNAAWDGYRVCGPEETPGINYYANISSTFMMEPNEYLQVLANTTSILNSNQQVISLTVEKDFSNTNMAHIIKPAVAILKDVKAYNVGGGTPPNTTAFNDRELNTIEGESWFVTLSGTGTTGIGGTNKEFTLDPGTYKITSNCPNYNGNYTSHRLYDVTNSVTVLGSGQGFPYANVQQADTYMKGVFTIGSSTQYKIQNRVSNANSDGYGVSNPYQPTMKAVYTQVMIEKLK